MYAKIADILKRFGGRELAQVVNAIEEQDVVLTIEMLESNLYEKAKLEIETKLKDASSIVDSYLSDVYVLPLERDGEVIEVYPQIVVKITCDIARYLFNDDIAVPIGEGEISAVRARYKDAIKKLEDIREGTLKLEADKLYKRKETIYHI